MDAHQFDRLVRALARRFPRRELFAIVAGLATATLGDAAAKRHHRKRTERRQSSRRRVQADKKKGKNKACPPCKTRKQGKCRGNVPDGTGCPGGSCLSGQCVSTPVPPPCIPSCGGNVCGGNGCGGVCGTCVAGTFCEHGTCVPGCSAGLTSCGDRCVDLRSDAGDCGGCGNACTGDLVCHEGTCACPPDKPDLCAGACVDLQTDSNHCGTCGTGCRFPHATANCERGACILGACDAGWADCDDDPTTGCELDTTSDPTNCGACRNECIAPENATATCTNSTCSFTCAPGFHDCGGSCVSDSDPAHCGSRCTPCPSSVCSPATCDGSTCGRDPVPGCCEGDSDCGDSNACTSDTCGADHTCQHTDVVCPSNNPCQDPVCDPDRGCTTVDHCPPEMVCVADGAQAHCCPQSRPYWGGSQCVECTSSDVTRCDALPNATPTCDGQGICSFTCHFGWGDCGPDPGCETNLQQDRANCGACGHACASGQGCSPIGNGTCQCLSGWTQCGGKCVHLSSDPLNCGACGSVCSEGQTCQGGRCTSTPWITQTTFGGQGSGPAEFEFPRGVAASADGTTLFVADTDNHRISVWTRGGTSTTDWSNQTTFGSGPGSGPSELRTPNAVAVSSDGLTAYVADGSNGRISVWRRSSASGTDWTNQATFGSLGSGPDQFDIPEGVSVSGDGLTAFIADFWHDRISVWTRSSATSADWTHQATFGDAGPNSSQLSGPDGVAVTEDGLTIFVADYFKERVAVWTRTSPTSTDWTYQTSFGTYGNGVNQFFAVKGVAVTGDSLTAFVADPDEQRIAIWRRSSETSTDWTYQSAFGSEAGLAAVAVSSDGNTAFVVDYVNSRVEVWNRS